MNWVDFAILGVIALSAVVGFFRGFLRETIGLVTWALAFYFAFTNAQAAAGWFQQWLDSSSLRMGAGFAVIFIAVLIVGAVINYLIGRLVKETGFSGTDHTLGGLFGVLRGVAILVLLVLLAGMTPLPRDGWWQQSIFMDHLQAGAVNVRSWLPERFAQAIVYPSELDTAGTSAVVRQKPDASTPFTSSSS